MEKWSFQRTRELMTPRALRGMAVNEVGRARISMMVRSTSSNSRPDTLVQDRTPQPHRFLLQRTAGPYIGSRPYSPASLLSLATHGGSIHWCKTVLPSFTAFSCNARRVHTLVQDRTPQLHCFLLQRTAGPYIGARPYSPASLLSLATHGGSIHMGSCATGSSDQHFQSCPLCHQ